MGSMCFRYILLFLLVLAQGAAAHPYTLVIKDNQLPGAALYIAVYSDAATGWDNHPDLELKFTLPDSKEVHYPLDLPSGHYALRAFVDLNDNQTLDTNNKNRPREPFSTSIGSGRKRPSPSFTKSIRPLTANSPVIELKLRYPKATQDTDPPAASQTSRPN
ncbi:DUF2141 domain-containing protein [Gilvimarinus agarilyticus]|uniref:DUF2141 domain-containing protein n=1 Tax=Gilvimarinus sp. 2_MG-2023 TaxID=3062666 RepID=UPI001C08A7B7|nr:DUF2141 domain-containing protein [Gilvimarinus sp. 2_MG-2023]MBU2885726.1 DUF2141 domain-containing protein [Gilvimarinus agarilyticus]MDO6570586.1 DUF2141 domain-containing protein [Gilvimarinus sp. 2_MG-2023]